ncbi:fatty acid CoA ligase family protein [Schlesneria paludicola]|uniref:fatty acid CoA ligase family protein n=1 Tax=Schlesneria paludicola TaxID=360056 RepID=UPI000299D778|nr:fatty acid CoA ligase family protein [Schlesneria paludicola]
MPTINIASHLTDMAVRSPEQLAVLFPQSRDRSGKTEYAQYTYHRLEEESNFLAAGLDSMGIGRGVKTVLMVPPSLEFFSLTFALFKVGAIPVMVDPGMGIKNLGKCLAEAEPTAFIGVTKAHVARLLFRWARRSLKQLVTVGRKLGWGGVTLSTVTESGRKRQSSANPADEHWIAHTVHADETAAILFTSGSTGIPKGAVYSHGNFTAQVAALKQAFQIEPGEVDLCTFPLFALFAPALGMTAVVPRMDFTKPARVIPREIEEPIVRFGINNLFGSPALLNRVGREFASSPTSQSPAGSQPADGTPPWKSLRRVLSAGAPVSPLILERFSQRLSETSQIFTPYGATESLPVAVIGSHEILRETRYRTAEGAGTCVGHPVTGIEVRIIRISDDPIAEWNDSLCVAPGEIGEIVVHGPMVTQQYYLRPDLTALAKIRDPATGRVRHRMGDVGYFDEQGRLWFCGRKSHRVETAERTYFTEPVEGIFNTHPAVFRTALVGVRRADGVEPILCVERERSDGRDHQQLSDDELTKQLLEIGAKFETSRPIRTILFHPSFPVDIRHNSKIFREKLAVWAASTVGLK